MAVEHLTCEIVELTRYKAAPVAPKPEGKLWILHPEEHEAIRCGEPAIGEMIIENESDRSKGGVFYGERHRCLSREPLGAAVDRFMCG